MHAFPPGCLPRHARAGNTQAIFAMSSRPAIETAISTLPVKNQLIANVSRVPSVRQLTALRTDRECVSAPRKSTRQLFPSRSHRACHATASRRQPMSWLDWHVICLFSSRPASLDVRRQLCYVRGVAAPVNAHVNGRVPSTNGVVMRLIALLVAASGAVCALSVSTLAQTGECRSIADPAARLACYDKAAPAPAANARATAAKPLAAASPPTSSGDSSRYVDSIGEEEALVNAKLHGICRGC
jgi:hypothetical protein